MAVISTVLLPSGSLAFVSVERFVVMLTFRLFSGWLFAAFSRA